MKRFNKIIGIFIGTTLLASCANDDGPSIDDHFLNYEIPQITLDHDCPVGVYYYNNGNNGMNEALYERVLEETNEKTGNLGPNVRPILGNYKIAATEEGIANVQQHVDWCIEGGVDFFVLPGCQEHIWTAYPYNINPSDTTFYALVTGRIGSDGKPKGETTGTTVNLKSLKYVLTINLDQINVGLSNTLTIENAPTTTKEGVVMTRIDRFNEFFQRLSDYFNDPNYYRYDNKPIVLLLNAHRLYSADSRKLFDNMRAYVKEHCGDDMFLVVQQEGFTPPARYEYFYINGKVDAITHRNMYNQTMYDRSYWYPQAIDQNWIYSRELFMSQWGIDYIPAVAPSFNMYVYEGRNYDYPIVRKNEETFRTICNVAKKNLGKNKIVFIDSFNQWQYDTCLEPTDPEYGKGYGMTYLNIVKEQFKK